MGMKILTTMLTSRAVYWAPTGWDGMGTRTFDTPVEFDCRWEKVQELFLNEQGVEELSRAVIYVAQDVLIGGWLAQGSKDDYADSSAALGSDPTDSGIASYEIKQFSKLPTLKGDEYLRTVHV